MRISSRTPFVKQGIPLRYYKKEDSTLEIDFFLRTADHLVPVEVKATNNKAKSLSTLIKSDRYADIAFGIKLAHGNIGFANNVYTFPSFCTFLLKRYLATGALEAHYEDQKEAG